jgi:hypothetical protein
MTANVCPQNLPRVVIDRHTEATLDGETAATAWFDPTRRYRYALTRQWGTGPAVAFIMCNPSTADAFLIDPTVERCLRHARRWGAGQLVVLNAFALRSTDPAELYRAADPVGPHNDATIRHYLTGRRYTRVMAAWGVHPQLNGRCRTVADLIRGSGHRPECFKHTKGGHPIHPLYQRADAQPIPWKGYP